MEDMFTMTAEEEIEEPKLEPGAREKELDRLLKLPKVSSMAQWDGLNQKNILNPLKAVQAKCMDCSGGSPYEVTKCAVGCCPLFPYRFGCRPRPQKAVESSPGNKGVDMRATGGENG